MQQNWLPTVVAIAHGFSATTVGAASAFLVERCGRCTSWQTAGGPGGTQILGMVRGEWLLLPPRRTGGSGLLGHCCHLAPQAVRVRGTPSLLVLYGSSSSSVALRAGSSSPLCLCVGSPSRVALCAGSTSPSCLCVGAGLGVAQLLWVPWLLCVVGRCVPGRVLLRSLRGLFFCVATQSCVSLQSEGVSFVILRSQQFVSGWSHALVVPGALWFGAILPLISSCQSVCYFPF